MLVTDDEDRENEGDVILAAETLTTEWLAWTVRHTSGVVCAPMPGVMAERLGLPPMVVRNEDPRGTAYTVSVDARAGITHRHQRGGPRPHAAAARRPLHHRRRPGPARARVPAAGARRGSAAASRAHTEAAVDLCRLAGLAPVGVIAELVHDDGSMMRLPAVLELGAEHDLPVITIAQLIDWRQRHDRVDAGGARPGCPLPTACSTWWATGTW